MRLGPPQPRRRRRAPSAYASLLRPWTRQQPTPPMRAAAEHRAHAAPSFPPPSLPPTFPAEGARLSQPLRLLEALARIRRHPHVLHRRRLGSGGGVSGLRFMVWNGRFGFGAGRGGGWPSRAVGAAEGGRAELWARRMADAGASQPAAPECGGPGSIGAAAPLPP